MCINICPCFVKRDSSAGRLRKFYSKGVDRMDEEMNIVKILTKLRNINAFFKHSVGLMKEVDRFKFKLNH
jgi:hypothetical protein